MQIRVRTLSVFLLLAAISLSANGHPLIAADTATSEAFTASDAQFFENEVLPILKRTCFKCHGGRPELEGGFRLTSRAGILKGGENGPAVDLKHPGDSELISAIRYEGLEMPPNAKLPAENIAVLEKWVKLGLPWSDTTDYGVPEAPHTAATDDDGEYWAYQPIKRPELPAVKHSDWARNNIDRFVLARVEARGLTPTEPADKVALLRRAYYDLTGLPPSPEDVDRFVADTSPDAFEAVIDRLLESPQYGERWGRHWLDIVRYAETHGYERDSPKPEAWRFRDYVIDSFNADKPYDQFIIEQLAGDELPDATQETLTATGFYRLGIWDDEPADRLLARYDGLDDIVKTTSEAVLGTTMGCVRCHSHKADPIKHEEYYGFLAWFHDITYSGGRGPNGDLRFWVTDADRKAHEQRLLDKQKHEDDLVASIRSTEARFKRQLKNELNIEIDGKASGPQTGTVLLADSREQRQEWEYTLEKPSNDWKETDYSTTSWEKGRGGFGQNGTPGIALGTQWTTSDIWLRRWFKLDEVPKQLALDIHHDEDVEIYLNGVQVFSAKGYTVAYQREPLKRRALQALKAGENVIAIHCRQTGGGQYIDAGLVIPPARADLATALKQYGAKVLGSETFNKLNQQRKELEASRKRRLPPAGTPILAVSESGRAPVHVLLRGNPHSPGDQVEPTVPAALNTKAPQVPDVSADAPSSGKRLAIARWMFADDNPLTARVIVNRLWQHHFGRGIVPTPNDFGKLGDRPTHPELLDWLASEMMAGDWKIKRMHKLIMLSAAYQMSSRPTGDGLLKDPGNETFWRFNMRRLSSEELRDSILSVTGELNLKQGGPSIYVPIPQAVLAGQSRPGAGWGNSPPNEAARRSVYIHVKRSLLVPILEMHDQADTDSSCPVRYVTTVPTQSLGMLNGEFTNEKAGKLAEQLRKTAGDDTTAQVRQAIRVTTGRQPTAEEVQRDLTLIDSLRKDDGLSPADALKMYCLLTLNTNEFVYLD
ncbi:MAG: PSD1 and planctomycete cytochrome C domain-containing protein [Planctomycetota bacterium]|jgi:hypothetical protein